MRRDVERSIEALRHLPAGDLAAREHVVVVRDAIASAGDDELLALLRRLDALDVDPAHVEMALETVHLAAEPVAWRRALGELRVALEPARDRVLGHLAGPPGELRLILTLRAGLLRLAPGGEKAELAALDDDLRRFLASRFDVGILELRRLTWQDSAALLERLARSEAVHAVRGWFDLKDRLDEDRRVYAFFHPALPDVPLAFTEVALTEETPATIRAILNRDAPRVDPAQARAATFYSITSAEPGLTGIPLGNALIKRCVERLRNDLPKLRTFATLSPMPGFAAWLRSRGDAVPAFVRQALATPGWQRDATLTAELREPMLRLGAQYLVAAKRADGAPRDAVERFHLGNGASADRVNWLGDPSQHGVEQSYGLMVNYRYALDRVGANQVAYAAEHRIAASASVRGLATAAEEEQAAAAATERRSPLDRLLGAVRALPARWRRRSSLDAASADVVPSPQ
ncbi:MAG TPA: malonyl-CoA decarboxylase family protein [Candidatus Sulfotelmatobacter sp.]|nr:malonyl-CoA decarboxylase family protein [Candidatus Sulfotelmatobacter sp.]